MESVIRTIMKEKEIETPGDVITNFALNQCIEKLDEELKQTQYKHNELVALRDIVVKYSK